MRGVTSEQLLPKLLSEVGDWGEDGEIQAKDEAPPVPEEISCAQRLHRLLPLFGVGVLIAAGAIFHHQVSASLKLFVTWCQALGMAGPVILGLMVAALQLLMLPTFPLMVGAGVIFPKVFGYVLGQTVGVMAVFCGLWVGSMVTFLLGRRCFKEWAEEELKKFAWMSIVNNMIDEQGWWVVLLARMSPLLPAEVFNYACSLTSLSLGSFGIGCLGSVVPTCMWVCGTATAASAASAAGGDDDDAALDPRARRRRRFDVFFLAFNVLFLLVLTLVLYSAFRKYKEKAAREVDQYVEATVNDIRVSFGQDREVSAHRVTRMKRELTMDLQRLRRPRGGGQQSRQWGMSRSVSWSVQRNSDIVEE